MDRAGSSALSGGELYLGGGTAIQQACGFSDTADDMFDFLSTALGPHADLEKVRLYCYGSVDHYEWLVSCGVVIQPTMFEGRARMPATTDGLKWLGENARPYNEIAKPAPRGHRGPVPMSTGQLLMDTLVAHASSPGVSVEVDTRATSLIVEDGRVVGVNARRYGADESFRADSVVLTTGGFVDNEQMLADHAPSLLGHGKVSDGLDDGSGILMAQGRRRRHPPDVDDRSGLHRAARDGLPRDAGQLPGPSLHQRRRLSRTLQPRGTRPARPLLGDHRRGRSRGDHGHWGIHPSFAAETPEELAADLSIPASAFAATVASYNRDAVNGQDPMFHKDSRWLRPLTGGLAAFDPRLGFFPTSTTVPGTGFSGFTLGGLHTTPDGHVLSMTGERIPGLYAAGRASSGMHGERYISGTSLGDGTFFGRRAGRTAAAS
ncbi:FAD-binding protein [Nocardioides sp. B-3]|uniref:FAD-binding protein n=1 Tax=Nocardioides sp. B-3 TaxID=2895565 RepID=UPI0021536F55|nr:FAD-binding protein [Nocardioides sp. B-3]UUZ59445.1 FAD-binding protein [Nocardioides sp. B-3]